MELGDALQRRMEELAKRQPMIDRRFAAIAEGATLRAVEEAQDHTPPNTTGGLAQHWSTDSQTAPVRSGSTYTTTLANDKEYASYVNDGHRMDRHFVPGMYVGDDGLLSMDPARDVGMMVGTRTRYVPGLYMREKGVDKYSDMAESELRKLAGEVLE